MEIFVDCKAAIAVAQRGGGKCPRLARKVHELVQQAREFMEVTITWVPSHGKQSVNFAGHATLPEYVVRAWNDRADRAAKRAQQARRGQVGQVDSRPEVQPTGPPGCHAQAIVARTRQQHNPMVTCIRPGCLSGLNIRSAECCDGEVDMH